MHFFIPEIYLLCRFHNAQQQPNPIRPRANKDIFNGFQSDLKREKATFRLWIYTIVVLYCCASHGSGPKVLVILKYGICHDDIAAKKASSPFEMLNVSEKNGLAVMIDIEVFVNISHVE